MHILNNECFMTLEESKKYLIDKNRIGNLFYRIQKFGGIVDIFVRTMSTSHLQTPKGLYVIYHIIPKELVNEIYPKLGVME